jgi:penicillin-binding protein 1A
MALGTTLVTPLEMTQAYATFANGGDRIAAYGLERIRTARGQVLYQRKPIAPAPAVGNPPLSELNQMLRSVMVSGTGVNARVAGYDLAGKTGTTSDYKDAWFCGFTGGFASCVWMGRDDAKPMVRVSGAGAPSEAWRSFMTVALKRVPVRAIPPGPPPPTPLPSIEQAAEPGVPVVAPPAAASLSPVQQAVRPPTP